MGLRHLFETLKYLHNSSKSMPSKEITHRKYDDNWRKLLNYNVRDNRLIPGAFVDWDNTPRNKLGLVYDGADPEKFNYYIGELYKKIQQEYSTELLFVNAWNEWAEGAYLEPDEKFGYGYLEAFFDHKE